MSHEGGLGNVEVDRTGYRNGYLAHPLSATERNRLHIARHNNTTLSSYLAACFGSSLYRCNVIQIWYAENTCEWLPRVCVCVCAPYYEEAAPVRRPITSMNAAVISVENAAHDNALLLTVHVLWLIIVYYHNITSNRTLVRDTENTRHPLHPPPTRASLLTRVAVCAVLRHRSFWDFDTVRTWTQTTTAHQLEQAIPAVPTLFRSLKNSMILRNPPDG